MKRLGLLLIFVTAMSLNLSAQSAGGGIMLGFPQGEFKDNIDRIGFGASGQVLFFNPSAALALLGAISRYLRKCF